ncbi:MAG: beta-lactamase family protein [Clostridiales bacterium]|jgi:CubicO group peptidase (beta-lactamase class C family)|nr:beta-lactamase family protein [Clostridiales bacterium]
MKYLHLYRLLTKLLPAQCGELQTVHQHMSEEQKNGLQSVLKRHRASGGAIASFDEHGIKDHFVYGDLTAGQPLTAGTAFRLASVSKLVTAAGVMAMSQQGLINLDEDTDLFLPYSLRHPKAPELPITLRMLLTHTSAIIDSPAYFNALESATDAQAILEQGSHAAYLPGQGCEYSNFAYGLIACVLEAKTGLSFENLMQQYLFEPLCMQASFYPARLEAPLADACRILPPQKMPNYSGKKRKAAGDAGCDQVDVQRHYLLSQGNACMDVDSLVKLGQALLQPGFFTQETLTDMLAPHASLSGRDPFLRQGLGVFLLDDDSICGHTLYGHQGMAYGAVHLLFLDVQKKKGILSLTTGASEARRHILADLNRALLQEWCKHG